MIYEDPENINETEKTIREWLVDILKKILGK